MSSILSCKVLWAEACLTTLPHMLLSHRQIPHLFAQCVILREARITHNSKRYYLCFCYRVHDLYVLSLAIAQAYALVKTSLQTVPIRQNGIVVSCSQGAQLSISAYQYPFMHKVYVHFILTIHFRCRYWLPTRIYGMQRSETMLCIDSWTLWWESYLWGQLRWVGLWSVSKHFLTTIWCAAVVCPLFY